MKEILQYEAPDIEVLILPYDDIITQSEDPHSTPSDPYSVPSNPAETPVI